jgi:uncharacterized protein YecE (DUF72 family)
MKRKGKIRIGTSGWSYTHWKGPFYPADITDRETFQFYCHHLNTVEINSSFYHLPLKKTFENWRASSSDDFIFSVKASRFITHNKKLADSAEAVERFFERASGLGEKIGPVLFQLPPGLKMDTERLRTFLELLPANRKFTFEFRNAGWFHPEVYALLSEFGASICLYELGGFISPMEITAGFVYLRLHGPAGKYQGRYSTQQLQVWQERIKRWASRSGDIFCYFDNDEGGFAALNALELQRMVDRA